MSRFQPNFGILPEAQKALWPFLAGARSLGMVLYGGTAIALRLGHRPSVDFDFFSKDELPSRDIVTQALPFLMQSKILQDQKNTLGVRRRYFYRAAGRLPGKRVSRRSLDEGFDSLLLLLCRSSIGIRRLQLSRPAPRRSRSIRI
jgi:hypothetical protein